MTEEYQPHEEDLWKKRCAIMQKNKLFPYVVLI